MMVLENTDILRDIWVAQFYLPHQKLSNRQHDPPIIDDMVNILVREQDVWVDLWSTIKPTITCPMSFNWFPFDHQKCYFIIRVHELSFILFCITITILGKECTNIYDTREPDQC